MSKTYKGLFSVLKQIGFIVFLLFVATAINYKMQPAGEKYYKGVSEITPTQFFSIKPYANNFLTELNNSSLAKSTYVVNDDGTLKLTYSFVSLQDYSFLKTSNLQIWNYFPISSFTPNAVNNLWYSFYIFAIIALFWLNWYRSKNPMRFNEKTTQFRHWREGLSDNGIKPPTSYDVTSNASDINIQDSKGIIAVRVWKVEKGKLKSVVQDTVWQKAVFNADSKNLKENSEKGIYAYRIGSLLKYSGIVMGIIEMQGQYYYHSDIIRSEYCVIKCLFMSKGRTNLAKVLSNHYGVKVLLGDRKEQAYTDWLFSKNGLQCLEHNQKLLEDENGSRAQSQEAGLHSIPETSGNS